MVGWSVDATLNMQQLPSSSYIIQDHAVDVACCMEGGQRRIQESSIGRRGEGLRAQP